MDIINEIYKNVNILEGKHIITKFLEIVYLNQKITAKYMSRILNLPIPIISAIKNEYKKKKLVKMEGGITLTEMGIKFVENNLGYKGLDIDLYKNLEISNFETLLQKQLIQLDMLLHNRPSVDVTIDQSKCTSSTSIKRSILALKNNMLINKKILCIGDDDLISVSTCILLQALYKEKQNIQTEVTVIDIDERILSYIEEISVKYNFNIKCIQRNLKKELPFEEKENYDCIFTDPPYTLEGLNLFVSRGISALKDESNLKIFLSFGNKSPVETLTMQGIFYKSALEICAIYKNFNYYEGADIIGNTSNMYVLGTTNKTQEIINKEYTDIIYTGEIRKTSRIYECKNCKETYEVSMKSKVKTIEELKEDGCKTCKENKFILKSRCNL